MVSRTFAVAAAVALVAPFGQAQAATMSIDMPGCASVALSGQPPNYTLTCTPVAQLCSMTASAATPSVGTPVTLTVGCVPPATSVAWEASRGCNAPVPVNGNPMQAVVAQSAAINCVYSATAATSGITSSTTVSWGAQVGGGGGGVSAPSGCAVGVTPSASLSSAGGQVNLSATCSGGGTVTKWTWRRDATSNVSTAQGFADTLASNTNQAARTYTYGVVACAGPNQDVCAAEVTRTVQVAGAGSQGASLCPANAIIADMAWGDSYITSGVGPGVTFAGRFTVPSDPTPNTRFGQFYPTEYSNGPAANRLMTLSTRACDFRNYAGVYPVPQPVLPPGDATGVSGPLAWAGGGFQSTGPSIAFLLVGDPQQSPPKPLLTPGQTYFLNIQTVNWDLSNSCNAPACDMRITFTTPH